MGNCAMAPPERIEKVKDVPDYNKNSDIMVEVGDKNTNNDLKFTSQESKELKNSGDDDLDDLM